MYLSWALFVEGGSDRDYLEALLPRVIEDIVLSDGKYAVEVPANCAVSLGTRGRSVEAVAKEACEGKDAFQLLFIHADTGGRGISQGIESRSASYVKAMTAECELRGDRAVIVAPKHETEAWLLADRSAFLGTLGYRDPANDLQLPANASDAERLVDPKAVFTNATSAIFGRRKTAKREVNYGSIALRQDLNELRGSSSFRAFEASLRSSLATWNII